MQTSVEHAAVRRPGQWLLTAVVAMGLLLSACGGPDDSTADKAPPIPETPAGERLRWTLDQLNGVQGTCRRPTSRPASPRRSWS